MKVNDPMTHPTDALRLVPNRDDGLRVGRAILEAHSQWEKEHGVTGAQKPWSEQHVMLLGQAAILAAPASPLPEGGVEALIAELKEARAVIDRLASSEAFDMPQAISGPLAAEMRARMDYARAFLARNGKGER